MLLEQTEIAKRLGISMNALHRILNSSGLSTEKYFKLINNKRHYEYEDVLKAIRKGL
jgi:hypothetical protein